MVQGAKVVLILEERPFGRVSKDASGVLSWFETREGALLTMRHWWRRGEYDMKLKQVSAPC
jgi:hypothetical protein